MELLPSLQHVLADVLHVTKRVWETLSPRHPKIGECAAVRQGRLSGLGVLCLLALFCCPKP